MLKIILKDKRETVIILHYAKTRGVRIVSVGLLLIDLLLLFNLLLFEQFQLKRWEAEP